MGMGELLEKIDGLAVVADGFMKSSGWMWRIPLPSGGAVLNGFFGDPGFLKVASKLAGDFVGLVPEELFEGRAHIFVQIRPLGLVELVVEILLEEHVQEAVER